MPMHLVARFTLIAVLLWPAAVLAAPAGTVVGLSGDCTVEHAGSRGPVTLAQGVEIGDIVEVAANGKLKLRMADGSVVSVASGTKMTVAAYGVTDSGQRQDAKLSLSQGLLRLEVTPVTGTPAPFEVETAVGTSAVRSTDWFVETQRGWMQVAVLTGSVTLTSAATGAVTTIPARQGARLEAGTNPAATRAWTAAEFTRLIARTALPRAQPTPKKPARGQGPQAPQAPTKSSDGEYVPPPGGEYASPPGGGYTPPPPSDGYYPPPGGGYAPPPGGYIPPRGDGYFPPSGRGHPSYPGGGGVRSPGTRGGGNY